MMPAFQDLTGQKFGRLTVIERVVPDKGRAKWLCRCECGKSKAIVGTSLTKGVSTSCGCFRKEQLRDRVTTHGAKAGGATTPEYSSWCAMLNRATNTKGDRYSDYGGRGIGVCESWKSFETFLKDMGPRPEGTSLDRIDNNLGYFLENCRWASHVEQSRNRRNNRLYEYNGQVKTIGEWSELTGIRYLTLHYRLTQSSMTVEEAITKPVGRWAK